MADEAQKEPQSALKQEPIDPKILERFSMGDIQFGEDMKITGEGEGRKIIITLKPDDPSYLDYQKRMKLSMEDARASFSGLDSQGSENEMIATALETKKEEKRILDANAFSRRITVWIKDNEQNLLNQINTPDISSKADNFSDLMQYIGHLFEQRALETILPEQQVGQQQPR